MENFHLFPRLPKEIRDHIWSFFLPDPRIVEVGIEDQRWPITIRMKNPEQDELYGVPSILPYPYRRVYEVHDYLDVDEGGYVRTQSVVRFAGDGNKPYQYTSKYRSEAGSKPPAIIHVSHESRAAGITKYATCLSVIPDSRVSFTKWDDFPEKRLPPGERVPNRTCMLATPGIRFQPSRDTIFCPSESGMKRYLMDRFYISEIKTDNIQSFAISLPQFDPGLYASAGEESEIYIQDFAALKELFLLYSEEDCNGDESDDTHPSFVKKASLDPIKFTKDMKLKIQTEGGFGDELDVNVMKLEDFKAMPRWGGYNGIDHIKQGR